MVLRYARYSLDKKLLEYSFTNGEIYCDEKGCEKYVPHFYPKNYENLEIIEFVDSKGELIKRFVNVWLGNSKIESKLRVDGDNVVFELYKYSDGKLKLQIIKTGKKRFSITYLYSDYDINDFLSESRESKLERILSLINHPVRGFIVPWILYNNGRLSVSEIKSIANEQFVGVPKNTIAYKEYLDDTMRRVGLLTRLNMVTKGRKIIYKEGKKEVMDIWELTSFGEIVVERVLPRLLDVFLKYKISSEIFGHPQKQSGKRAPVNTYKSLEFLYKKGIVIEAELIKYLNARSRSSILKLIKRLERYRIINVVSHHKQFGRVVYIQKFDSLDNIDISEIKRKFKLRCSEGTIIKVLEETTKYGYITANKCSETLKIHYNTCITILSDLVKVELLEGIKNTIIILTDTGRRFFEEISKIIEDTLDGRIFKEEPLDIKKEDLQRLLDLGYSEKLKIWGRTKDIILEIIYSNPGIDSEIIHKITNINMGTLVNYISEFLKEGLIISKRIGNKSIYFPKESILNELKKIGVEREEIDLEDYQIRQFFYEIHGRYYPKKYLILRDEQGNIEIYRFTENAYRTCLSTEYNKSLEPMCNFLLRSTEIRKESILSEKNEKLVKWLMNKRYIEEFGSL